MLKVLYFTAPWCGPCKVFGPLLTETVNNLKEQVEMLKIDGEEEPSQLTKHNIRAFPTIVLFKGDKEVHRHTGLMPKTKLEETLKNAISKG